ncbi:alpha-hydroxyketone-type quorum-sensing autoinducer synthase [Legionella jordanis]|uniref:Aminotransferase class II n=1 Tax=Legionella jordanis TaxID=456 RepID=A0A0W0VBU3_9GAMM|nr:alpha-hydroxyketone-type quorum-sensing autoinducer synthase [Legionella jordanis]KTD17560.1 aminotransferase class II [Legionella jordanis]RMX05104.1 quorum-sensing autoinducer synthase [Legionella jordanis]RMX17360.1 quorum-sensing autoinducer synthase [Legionella jordanis]VEH13529.1 aminotransferase class II [Legionella jordanis]HAT8714445.1 quorum-sensing autoinducer synthase [Legionella jordanis]
MLSYKNHPLNSCEAKTNSAAKCSVPSFIHSALQNYFEVRVQESWQGHHILKGKKPSNKALLFTSNDYLHISRHPNLIQAQIEVMQKHGNGQMQSPVFLTDDSLLADCEQQFADFTGFPACLLAQSGWCANIGLIQALAPRELPVYLDFYAHMSFWEGVKAARAKPIPFQHNSVSSLRKRLERYGSGIIAVDSVYSTTGTISPLREFVRLAKEYNCLLIVDESHSLGTHGSNGSGLVAELGLTQEVDIITASLAKAISGRGGLILGQDYLIELIRYTALPSIFSSTLLPHDLAGFRSALAIIATEEWRRQKLHSNARFLREALLAEGFNLRGSQSQIIPLIAGSEANTIWLRNELEKKDIHGAVFCSPATPKNNSLIRLSINSQHEYEQLSYVVDCLLQIRRSDLSLPLFTSYT